MPTSRTSPAGGAPVGTSWGRPGNRFVPRTRKPLGVPLNPAVAASDVTNEIDSAARARLTPTLRSRGYAPRAIDNESKDLSRSLQVLPILMRPAHAAAGLHKTEQGSTFHEPRSSLDSHSEPPAPRRPWRQPRRVRP